MTPEEQNALFKSFLEPLVNSGPVTEYAVLVKTRTGFFEFTGGDMVMINGMLDFAKREQWLKIHGVCSAQEKRKQQEAETESNDA